MDEFFLMSILSPVIYCILMLTWMATDIDELIDEIIQLYGSYMDHIWILDMDHMWINYLGPIHH